MQLDVTLYLPSCRLASPKARAHLNQSVTCVRASPAEELLTCPGVRLGERFPRLRTFHAEDTGDAPLTDDLIISFLSESVQSLQRLQEVNVKQCHYVGRRLLAFLQKHCPSLARLSASRWTNNGMLYEMARFHGLQVGVSAPVLKPWCCALFVCRYGQSGALQGLDELRSNVCSSVAGRHICERKCCTLAASVLATA